MYRLVNDISGTGDLTSAESVPSFGMSHFWKEQLPCILFSAPFLLLYTRDVVLTLLVLAAGYSLYLGAYGVSCLFLRFGSSQGARSAATDDTPRT